MNDFLEEFENYDNINDEDYKELCKTLIKDLKQYSRALMKDKDIILSFPNLRDISSIYCEQKKIVVNKKILKLVSAYLIKEFYSNSLISKNIDENLKKSSLSIIREFILQFIILHEFAHIELEHLKIKLDKEKIKYSSIFMEFDADKRAINFLAGKYLKIIDKKGVCDYSYLIEKLMLSLIYLFHFIIYSIESKKSHASHPKVLERVIVVLSAFVEPKYKIKDIINLSLDEIIKIRDKCLFEFYSTYGKKFQLTESKVLDAFKIVDKYSKNRLGIIQI